MEQSQQIGRMLRAPVRVEAAARPVGPARPGAIGVDAVVPCYNRAGDLALLLSDMAGLDLGGEGARGIRLRVLVVDNASERPLETVAVPPRLEVEFLRLERNTGGSGGFNAGLARVVAKNIELSQSRQLDGTRVGDTSYIWLVDSDARVRQDTLARLVDAMEARPDLCAAGSAVADPATGVVFEVGGRVCRRTGRFEPVHRGAAGVRGIVECDYVAACSALVRREAVERAGLMPDVFLNADDVEWFVRLARATGWSVGAVPESVVLHPTFDRFPTWARYYIARNCIGPVDALGLGGRVRFRRAMQEVARAVGQAMMGRDDLAALHVRGLADAVAGKTSGPAEGKAGEPALPFEAFHLFGSLAAHLIPVLGLRGRRVRVAIHAGLGLDAGGLHELDRQVAQACEPYGGMERVAPVGGARRMRAGAAPDVAIVPARGRPGSWFAGRVLVEVTAQGFVIREPGRLGTCVRAARVGARGTWLAVRLAMRRSRRIQAVLPPIQGPTMRATLGIVVLSYNRWPALRETLVHLTGAAGVDAGSIVVVDNGSSDGSADLVASEFPTVGLLRSGGNRGVEAFNRGAEHLLSGPDAPDVLLILDDDARPEPVALASALDLLGRRRDVGAVTLHPKHPSTGKSEWPFAAAVGETGDDRWPVMGCANLVRSWAWRRVGGYERAFFLYRNDADLALKLLGAGIPVHFNPGWGVLHDSPAAARKSERWHRLATRNWVWMMKRHATGPTRWGAILLGWGWAHRLARMSGRRHWQTLRGVVDGILRSSPAPPRGLNRGAAGEHAARLVRLQIRSRAVR